MAIYTSGNSALMILQQFIPAKCQRPLWEMQMNSLEWTASRKILVFFFLGHNSRITKTNTFILIRRLLKSQGKTEVPVSFSLLQSNTEMENLQKYKPTQEFLCRIATMNPKSSELSLRAVTATGTDIFLRDAL